MIHLMFNKKYLLKSIYKNFIFIQQDFVINFTLHDSLTATTKKNSLRQFYFKILNDFLEKKFIHNILTFSLM